MFVTFLGRFAGDMALTFKAVGGVYLAGGVASGLGGLLDEALFRAAFERYPPHRNVLAQIPASVMIYSEPGPIGCAAGARLPAGR